MENRITEKDKERLEDMEWWDWFRAGGVFFANQKLFEKRLTQGGRR